MEGTHVEVPLVKGVIDGRGVQGIERVYDGILRVSIDVRLPAADTTQKQARRVEARTNEARMYRCRATDHPTKNDRTTSSDDEVLCTTEPTLRRIIG